MNINKEQLSTFFDSLGATIKTARDIRKIYDRELALDFNPILCFWRIGENKLSEILAFFLDPNQSHGQGDIFLNSFLKTFFPNYEVPAYTKLEIKCELPTPEGRRLDIHIDFDEGNFGIGVENKIWAKDQYRQLADYSAFLERKHKGRYCLLYLTPYNRKPGENSISSKELDLLISNGKYYCNDLSSGISSLLEEWIVICRAETVKTFIRNLHQFIKHEVNGVKFMGQNELVADFVTADVERLTIALAIESANMAIKERLVNIFKVQLKEIADELTLEVDMSNITVKKEWPEFYFYNENLKSENLRINFSFAGLWGSNMCSGVIAYTADRPCNVAKIDILNRNGFPAKGSWPCFQYFEPSAGKYPNILNGDLKKSIKLKVEEIMTVLFRA